jgi:isopentenyl-diphosphate Delta-isomerase
MSDNPTLIVDENDVVIGQKPRSHITMSDIYRVAGLWLENGRGDVLLQQRAHNKHNDPGKWTGSAAGTIEVGEEYATNIVKEAHEELGIPNLSVTPAGPPYRVHGKHTFFCQIFRATLDWPIEKFVIQTEEVAQIAWVPRDQVIADFRADPDKFVPSFEKVLRVVMPELAI